MAVRPVFTVSLDNRFCVKENIEFRYFNGFSDTQHKKNIQSLHQQFLERHKEAKILEVSSKSADQLGVSLSAFNLKVQTSLGSEYSVESIFQASKVFERGGPYSDILYKPPWKAKKDERLRNSGKITAFQFGGKTFQTEPKTFFYNWLYINALDTHQELARQALAYDAFTDIAFNPQKSINCQAEAVAIYVSLKKQGLLDKALVDKEHFKKVVYPDEEENSGYEQLSLFDDE